MRSISVKTAAALKTSTQAAYDAVGGPLQAADLLGVGSPALSKYASLDPQWSERFIRIDLALDLDRRSGHPFILTTMAREAGFQLVRDEVPDAGDVTICPLSLLRLDRILDDVVDEVAAAIEDGKADAHERREIRKRIGAAKKALGKLDALMAGGE